MRIAHIVFSLRTGGMETMLVDILNGQNKIADVSLYIINDEINYDLLRKIDDNLNIVLFKRKPGTKNPFAFLKLNFHLLLGKYDIIHCHNHSTISTLLPFFRRKSILTIHTTGVESKYYSWFAKCFAISDAVKDDLRTRTGVVSKVIDNGIDFDVIQKKDYLLERLPNSEFRIIQIGRLDHNVKGQDVAIKALSLLVMAGMSNLVLTFVGEGAEREYLMELCEEYNVSSFVRFVGLWDRDYMFDHLKDYDLLIQPSLIEGFGLTIVEGMGAKVPVIVSNIPAPLEIVKDGHYGFFFQSGNEHALAEKIRKVREMEVLDLAKLVDRSYAYARDNFEIQRTVDLYMKEYCF